VVGLAGHLGLGISTLSLADTNMTDSLLQVGTGSRENAIYFLNYVTIFESFGVYP
jgi:hypothetical protein